MKLEVVLNPNNFQQMRQHPPQEFKFLRIDSLFDCNIHCVYCHTERNQKTIETEDLIRYFDENVVRVETMQMGCGMEPTLDPRLADLMLAASASKAKPFHRFRLQTNGTLLHRHDPEKMRRAGLTTLSVSIDSADPEIHRLQRGSTSLARILSNLEQFRKALPEVDVIFLAVVTKLSIAGTAGLIDFGKSIGVKRFEFREMLHHEASPVVDHARMKELILEEGEFAEMKRALQARFGEKGISFCDSDVLLGVRKRMAANSNLREPWAA